MHIGAIEFRDVFTGIKKNALVRHMAKRRLEGILRKSIAPAGLVECIIKGRTNLRHLNVGKFLPARPPRFPDEHYKFAFLNFHEITILQKFKKAIHLATSSAATTRRKTRAISASQYDFEKPFEMKRCIVCVENEGF